MYTFVLPGERIDGDTALDLAAQELHAMRRARRSKRSVRVVLDGTC